MQGRQTRGLILAAVLTESQRYPSFCLGHTRPDTCFGQATNLMESHNSQAIRLLPSGRYLAHTQCYHLIDMDVSSCKFRAGRPPARRFDHQPFGDALVRRKERAQVYKIDPPEAGKKSNQKERRQRKESGICLGHLAGWCRYCHPPYRVVQRLNSQRLQAKRTAKARQQQRTTVKKYIDDCKMRVK